MYSWALEFCLAFWNLYKWSFCVWCLVLNMTFFFLLEKTEKCYLWHKSSSYAAYSSVVFRIIPELGTSITASFSHICITPERKPAPFGISPIPSSPGPWYFLIYFLSLRICPFWLFQVESYDTRVWVQRLSHRILFPKSPMQLVSYLSNHLSNPKSWRFTPMFCSFTSYILFGFFEIYFELIFVHDVR